MINIGYIILYIVIGAIIGFLVAGLFAGNKYNDYESKINKLNTENNKLIKEKYELNIQLAKQTKVINMLNINNESIPQTIKKNNKNIKEDIE